MDRLLLAETRAMSRFAKVALGIATGASGYWLGTHQGAVASYVENARTLLAPAPAKPPVEVAAPSGTIVYWRDPDGRPRYSATPAKTADGRNFVGVNAADDVRLDATGVVRSAAKAAPAAPARRIRFYRNPMGLPDTSPLPKKDNMGMDYLPVYESGTEDAGIVVVSPGRMQSTGVRFGTAETRTIAQNVRVTGTVQLDERRVAVVATRSDAYVDKVADVTTGDRVRKGQPLLTLYSPEINAAAAQVIANPGFDGSRRRLENLNVPDAAIAEIERTHKVPSSIVWSAPRDGVILERGAIEGMKAVAGATLFRIADISTMWVLADVPERDIGSVHPGQGVAVTVRSQPGRTYAGHVDLIYPQVNAATRSTRVRIELPNLDGSLLADMYADVAIATGTPRPVVAVPYDAVLDTGLTQSVIVDRGGGRLEPRPVMVGVHGDDLIEIRQGVTPGDRIVTGANFLIDAESNLKSALAGLAAAGPDAQEARP